MRYIIKNCPAICINHNNEYDCDKAEYSCQDCTDCVMKRVVELCDSNASKVLYEGETIKFIEGNPLAKEILELFEIKECEDE